jgi:PilZ domain-containing protein
MPRTLLIASPQHHAGLLRQRDLRSAVPLDSGDSAGVLEAIKRERPTEIALERAFATSARGIALTNRLRTDLSFGTCVLRFVETRRAPRVLVPAQIEATVDGVPVKVIDISVIGAQLLSVPSIKPHQHLRLAFPNADCSRLVAKVAWSFFEMPSSGPRYRAGIEFVAPGQETLVEFITRITPDTTELENE